MRTYFFTLLAIFLCLQTLFGQNTQADLFVQSPDGKNVKLVWVVKKWNSDITGFDIKRKDGLQDWVKLNKEAIVPGLSMKKNFSASGVDKSEENLLKAKLYKLLSTRKLKETDNTYVQKLTSDENALHDMVNMALKDHELALMAGFAYSDHTINKKTDYQYGLFVAGTDKLLAKVSWNYGEIPDLSTITEITSKATTKTNGIQVIWNADPSKMKAANVAGFNVYREGIRLNLMPIITENDKDPTEFTWYDKSANSDGHVRYSISAESIFGIEGIIKSYTYDPSEHPKEYVSAEVTEVTSLGYYFKEGISIKWNFPKEYERFIKGFYVEKDNLPAGFNRVSPLLESSVHAYVDKTPSPVSSYVRFRVVVVYNDHTQKQGAGRVYSYFPMNDPPAPQGLKTKYTVSNKKRVVSLNWDNKMSGDIATDNYKVYVLDPVNNRYELINENHAVKSNSYVYNIPGDHSGAYKFYVSALSRSGAESAGSDTLTIQAGSIELPAPVIVKTNVNGNRAIIYWQYPEVQDLIGFRLYQAGNMIAGENELRKHVRNFMTGDLGSAGNYDFTLKAVSENGVVSDSSTPIMVTIPAGTK